MSTGNTLTEQIPGEIDQEEGENDDDQAFEEIINVRKLLCPERWLNFIFQLANGVDYIPDSSETVIQKTSPLTFERKVEVLS